MRLKGKVAIVTGGSQGIGQAICHAYSREGAKVAVVNARKPELGAAVAEKIRAGGGTASAHQCDVSSREQVRKLVEDYSEDDWDRTVNTNLKGAFLMVQAVLPLMKAKRSGKIVLMASIAATHAFPNAVPYCASKAGVWIMAKALCAEVAKFGINVNSISPGNTATPLNEHLQRDPEFVKLMQSYTPTGRAYLSTDEVAGAAVFLASEEARAIHGVDVIVDDGWCAM